MKTLFLILIPFMRLKVEVFAQDYASVNTSSNNAGMPNTSKKLMSYDFEVYNYVPEAMQKVTPDMAGNHFLGDDNAKKMYLFEEAYTYTEPIAPGNPATRTMYKKPVIYSSVKKIESLLKKSIKNKELTVEEATAKFNKVLDVVLNIKVLNTEKFEDTIKQQKGNASDLLTLFTEVHLSYTNN
jgi:hypothetical protein